MNLQLKQKDFTLALFSVVFWLILVDLSKFILTEYYYVFDKIDDLTVSGFIILATLFTTLGDKFLKKYQLTLLQIAIILLIAIFFHSNFTNYYQYRQRFPRIKKLSKNWTIQGDQVIIYGKNFGQSYQPGIVAVGDMLFNIKHWSSHKIIAEQPVPDKFFTGELKVVNHYQNTDTVKNFTIKDPAEL